MVACICHFPLHHQKPDFEGQSVIKASSYLLPFVLEAHRESLPRSCETSARRLSAESAEVYSTADLPASAAHIPFSGSYPVKSKSSWKATEGVVSFNARCHSNELVMSPTSSRQLHDGSTEGSILTSNCSPAGCFAPDRHVLKGSFRTRLGHDS